MKAQERLTMGRVPETRLYESVRSETLDPDALYRAKRRKLFTSGGKKIGGSYWYPAAGGAR